MSVTPANIAKNRRRLLRIYNQLFKHFGPRHWWPAEKAWEMMVGAILVQNTAWSNVEKAIAELKKARALRLNRIAEMPRLQLEKLIRSSGFYRQKAERLQRFARYLKAHPDFHKQLIHREGEGGGGEGLYPLRERLLSLNGIGPETADSILLYAGAYPTFVVDAYTRRVGRRMGLFRFDDYSRVQTYFQEALPKKAALYNEFHALIVWLAKHYCKKNDPLCRSCPLSVDCRYGHKRAGRNL